MHDSWELGASSTPPDPEEYTTLFESLWALERRTAESMAPEVQLALGVFTKPLEQPYRRVARRTWMTQRGVCPLQHGQQVDCSVYTTFVIGARGNGRLRGSVQKRLNLEIAGDPRQEEGMLVLNVTENMNDGKTFVYFRTIIEDYPWVTHVAKCDIDTYPALHKLVHRVHQQSLCEGSPYVYAGKPGSCNSTYLHQCNGYLPLDFHQTCSVPDGCLSRNGLEVDAAGTWSFNFGQLYILSAPLVRAIAVPGGVWEKPPFYTHEDQVTSFAVQRFVTDRLATETGGQTCLSVYDPQAWCHGARFCAEVTADTFNDF